MDNEIPKHSMDERSDSSRKPFINRFIGIGSLIALALALPVSLIVLSQRQDIRQQAAPYVNNTTPLGFGSKVGFDGANWRCKVADGANNEYGTGDNLAFSGFFYQKCKDQYMSDIDYLGKNNVKSFRLSTYLSQYAYDKNTNTWGNLNDNIKNLDEILARFAKNGIKVHIRLNNVYACGTQPGNYFDYSLFTNPTSQQQYLNAQRQFLERYKGNTTIVSYDLLNEVNSLIQTDYLTNVINKPTACMTASRDQIKGFLTQMYTNAKAADVQRDGVGKHKFTFSLSILKNEVKDNYLSLIKDIVDIYDIHMYVGRAQADNPDNYYKDFPVLDKPIIHGEVGYLSEADATAVDSNGKKCDSLPFEPDYPRAATMDCQQKILFNTKTWVEKAKQRGIDTLFFHNFNQTNRFFFRTYFYDSTAQLWKTSTYLPMLAGEYVIAQNNLTACGERGCAATSTPTPINIVTPTPDYSITPPVPTSLRTSLLSVNSVEVKWADVAVNETFFRFAYTPNTTPQNWKTVTLEKDTTSYILTGLVPGTSYYVGIQACNGDPAVTSTQKCSAYVTSPLTSTVIVSPTPTLTATPTPCMVRGGCLTLTPTPYLGGVTPTTTSPLYVSPSR